jgi:hypothetical protein
MVNFEMPSGIPGVQVISKERVIQCMEALVRHEIHLMEDLAKGYGF